MACSEAQLRANRANSLESTGPRTPEGKARSRQNALDHGLSGTGTVLSDEDAQAVQERMSMFLPVLQPHDDVEREVVFQISLASLRIERCSVLEASITRENRLRDLQLWDSDRELQAIAIGAELAHDPCRVVAQLRRFSAGCFWLSQKWQVLDDGLEEACCLWERDEVHRAFDLMAIAPEDRRLHVAARDLWALWQRATAKDGDQADGAAAVAELRRFIAEKIAELDELARLLFEGYENLSYENLQNGLRLDMSPEAWRARSMGATAQRTFTQGLRWLLARHAGQLVGGPPIKLRAGTQPPPVSGPPNSQPSEAQTVQPPHVTVNPYAPQWADLLAAVAESGGAGASASGASAAPMAPPRPEDVVLDGGHPGLVLTQADLDAWHERWAPSRAALEAALKQNR